MLVHYGIKDISIDRPVVTMGSFDGVHLGHRKVIDMLKEFSREISGESAVISFSPHPREVIYSGEKGPGILTDPDEKIALLDSCGLEHMIILPFDADMAAMSYSRFVESILTERLKIAGLVMGYDNHFGKNREGSYENTLELARKFGFELRREEVFSCGKVNISSTKIRTAISLGNIEEANRYLGYSYMLGGVVVPGDRIGRGMGFPTANIRIASDKKLLPAVGVYAVFVELSGKIYKGMMNIGTRPTVSRTSELRTEVHIFDFNGNIYGASLKLRVIARIRGEHRFENREELIARLHKDREAALSCLT